MGSLSRVPMGKIGKVPTKSTERIRYCHALGGLMRKLILRISISIDGFIESSDGKLDFAKSRSPEGAVWVAEKIGQAGAHLMGRKAFCEMASFWPNASGVLAKPMNEIPKIVFSKKGFDPSQASAAKSWADAK